jgi:hypothetical protein
MLIWERFQVLTVASMKMTVFWVVAQFSPAEVYNNKLLPDYRGQQLRKESSEVYMLF